MKAEPQSPPYTQMGRMDLIQYCQRLRDALLAIKPIKLVGDGDMAEAHRLESTRLDALNSFARRS